jgi:hypothetical protein
MFGKIALEEHWESPDFNAVGVHDFTNPEYFEGVQRRLENMDLRIEDMDRNGIAIYIISLTQPGIEGIPDAAKAVYIAKTMKVTRRRSWLANILTDFELLHVCRCKIRNKPPPSSNEQLKNLVSSVH